MAEMLANLLWQIKRFCEAEYDLKQTAWTRCVEVFDRVPKLPRRQQEHIVNWVSAYVSQYEQSRQ